MPDIRVRVVGMERLNRALRDPMVIRGPLAMFLQRAALVVEGHMKQKAPVDTGRLRASITHRVDQLQAVIGPTVTYAAWVEFGTRPHWPPPGALQPWAGRHGFPAGPRGDWLVRWIISRRGTKPHPYVRPAARTSVPEIKLLLGDMLNAIKARWNSHAV